ncbi:MAG: DUF2807 domain-containing protein [Actinomycetota bacterium]|nr:DUF2807 domain-containing protein [Actinomycetota bacterium]
MSSKSKNRASNILRIVFMLTLVSMLAIFAVSCKWTIGFVRGSGNIATEERDVSDFHKIHLSGIGNLIITQGEEESLTIEADDNIIPIIETDVFGERLNIGFKKGYTFTPSAAVKFYLTVVDLDEISLSGSGNIDCDDLRTEALQFDVSGAGDLDFDIEAERVEVVVSGAGNIILSGKVDSQKIEINGAGKYDGEDLESRECAIKVSGAGSATVNVSELLDVEINGVGNVYYAGNPSVKQDISGLGKIKSIE